MGKQAPPRQDYKGAAEATSTASHQDQSNPFGSQTWSQGPDGRWSSSSTLNGPLGGLAGNLQNQAAGEMSQPMDWGQFGQLGNGDQARDQAIQSAYHQSTSRLDPQWAQRDEQMGAKLANQGLDPNSQAYRNAMLAQGQQRNDAYGGAMSSAIAQGNAAGDSVFRNNMMSRQQAISEALRKRGGALGDLQGLQGFLPQYRGGQGADYLGAASQQGQADLARWQAENQANGDLFGGLFGGAAKIFGL